jgi:hypothetical protein
MLAVLQLLYLTVVSYSSLAVAVDVCFNLAVAVVLLLLK